ncbi:MAG TPA: glycosyltransferase family 2 protein, partial [Paludibacteraceae bacterium]|nr:glycosyltransferase family 2 protein [Paludibacteraceae bacterium]
MKIDCFIPYLSEEITGKVIETLKEQAETNNIFLLVKEETSAKDFRFCQTIKIDNSESSKTLQTIAECATKKHILLYTKSTELSLGQNAIHRLLSVSEDCDAGFVYADHFLQKGNK